MLKLFYAYVAMDPALYKPRKGGSLPPIFPCQGDKLVVAKSPEEAMEILDRWAEKEYLPYAREYYDYPEMELHWEEPIEVPIEEGVVNFRKANTLWLRTGRIDWVQHGTLP